jgi:transcriptional regulator with XRE-family HTH domain
MLTKNAIKKLKGYNRIKVLLVEKQKSNNWLAEKLDLNYHTTSRWCTNKNQPSLDSLARVAALLDVDIRELIVPTKQ